MAPVMLATQIRDSTSRRSGTGRETRREPGDRPDLLGRSGAATARCVSPNVAAPRFTPPSLEPRPLTFPFGPMNSLFGAKNSLFGQENSLFRESREVAHNELKLLWKLLPGSAEMAGIRKDSLLNSLLSGNLPVLVCARDGDSKRGPRCGQAARCVATP